MAKFHLQSHMPPINRKTILVLLIFVLLVVGGIYFSFKIRGDYPIVTPQVVGATTTAQLTSSSTASSSVAIVGKASSSTIPQNSSSPDSSTSNLLNGMKMTFDDEFNTFSRYVDKNGNLTCNPDGTGTWQTVYDFCSRTNPGNDEAEVYTDPNFWSFLLKEPLSTANADSSTNPFSLSNGVLSISANPSSPQVLAAVGPWAKYTSGIITTQFSFSQEYGYFEISAELPAGRGLWPAFWLLPDDKTWPPEIDALEAFGDTSVAGQGSQTMIHYASHALTNSENCGGWYNIGANITQGFHTYGVDWEPTGITYFFDGKPYASCPANSAADRPMYMLINLAVGSAQSWPGAPDASTTWPATLKIDYVRAYQKN
jgi:beta-glucanase (GH16 family)